jgi:hypothetical protein
VISPAARRVSRPDRPAAPPVFRRFLFGVYAGTKIPGTGMHRSSFSIVHYQLSIEKNG